MHPLNLSPEAGQEIKMDMWTLTLHVNPDDIGQEGPSIPAGTVCQTGLRAQGD